MTTTTKLLAARQMDTLGAGFHSDDGNLYLRMKETGARSWVFRYKQACLNGKRFSTDEWAEVERLI